MPYATRQGTINFPERKPILKIDSEKNVSDIKRTTNTKNVITTSLSSSARKALHSSVSGGITGRKKELELLKDFLLSHLDNQASGSIYVSGLPGTGKTASVNYVIEQNELTKKYQILKINCTAFSSSKAVFRRICEDLKLKPLKNSEKECINAVEKYLLKKHKMILVILDEIDQLESKSQSVLYKIFEWSSWKNSKFVLVGIANAMDLTDRNLPRLCCKVELKPILLHFSPYTKDEIAEILKNRLTEAGVDKMFAPGSVELISAKVAGTSGDVRRALDLGKRVIEIAEQNAKQQMQGNQLKYMENIKTSENSPKKLLKRKIEESSPNWRTPSKLESILNEIIDDPSDVKKSNLNFEKPSPQKIFKSSPRVCLGEITPQKSNQPSSFFSQDKIFRKSPRKLRGLPGIDENDVENNSKKTDKKLETNTPKEKVMLKESSTKMQFDVNSKDVLTVVKTVFGSSKNFKPSEESSFPLHQKLLICTMLLIIKEGKKKDLNVGKLHQVYSKICAKRGLTAVDKSGFLFLCRQVEVTGVLQLGKGPGTLAKITLQWDETEIVDSLKDLNMLSSILKDTSCLT